MPGTSAQEFSAAPFPNNQKNPDGPEGSSTDFWLIGLPCVKKLATNALCIVHRGWMTLNDGEDGEESQDGQQPPLQLAHSGRKCQQYSQ